MIRMSLGFDCLASFIIFIDIGFQKWQVQHNIINLSLSAVPYSVVYIGFILVSNSAVFSWHCRLYIVQLSFEMKVKGDDKFPSFVTSKSRGD